MFGKSLFRPLALALKHWRRPGDGVTPKTLRDARQVLVLEYVLPLGCCVHLTPLFAALKACRPDLVVSVATRGLGLAVLRHNPHVDHLIETPDALTETWLAARTLRKALAAVGVQPEVVLTGAADRRTRIGLLARLSTRGVLAGYTVAPELYDAAISYDDALSQIENNLRLAGLLGCEVESREPCVFFSEVELAAISAKLSQLNPIGRPVLVVVTQNSGGHSTGWHLDRFVEVIRHAHAQRGLEVLYVGTTAERDRVEAIRDAAGGIGTSLAGTTTVSELAALLALSDYVVSLDTGTMHVARAVGVPMVVLGPAWQRPIEWLPLRCAQVRILRGPDLPAAPPGYKLDEISAHAVIAALDDLLESYPAAEQRRRERVERSLSAVDHGRR